MTELERARAHLQRCQSVLRDMRTGPPYPEATYQRARVQAAHDSLLAALSWVWDAQERRINAVAEQLGISENMVCGIAGEPEREAARKFFGDLGFDPTKILIEHPDNAVDTWSATGLLRELTLLGVV